LKNKLLNFSALLTSNVCAGAIIGVSIILGCLGCTKESPKQVVVPQSSLDSLSQLGSKYLKIDIDTARLYSQTLLDLSSDSKNKHYQAKAELLLGRVYYEKAYATAPYGCSETP
jgi:hypothetical protein